MVKEITSKKEMIKKLKWLREKINEWGVKFQGKDYIPLPPGEKSEVFSTLRSVEKFFHLKYFNK